MADENTTEQTEDPAVDELDDIVQNPVPDEGPSTEVEEHFKEEPPTGDEVSLPPGGGDSTDLSKDTSVPTEEVPQENVDSGDNVALDEKSGHDSNGAAPDGEIKQPPPTEERKESEETTTGEGEQKPTGEDINEGTNQDADVDATRDEMATESGNAAAVETEETPEQGEVEGEEKVEYDEGKLEEGDKTEVEKKGEEEGKVLEGEKDVEEQHTYREDDDNKEGDDEEKREMVERGEQLDEDKTHVQQSDTFADGEVQEGPNLTVGEPLSREQSPRDGAEAATDGNESGQHTPPKPGTPDKEDFREEDEDMYIDGDQEEEYVDYEEEEDEDEGLYYNREQLMERYNQALQEREQLTNQSYQLQNKLGEYFRKKKAADETRQEVDKNTSDQEQRYLKYMRSLEELHRHDAKEREHYKEQVEDFKLRCQEKEEAVNKEYTLFMDFKDKIALSSANSRSGKPIPPRDVKQYLSLENKKENEVIEVRLENIKLKNKLKKKEQQRKSKEELADGLHLIDFEQLKIENQTYNEKIEERNEEILKLRKKINTNVQVLTHLKEKLQFVQVDNHLLRANLREVEEKAARKRDVISHTKQVRDALRINNQRLRQNCGLLGNEPLLRDFEERKDEVDELNDKLGRLKMSHAELTLTCNGVRRKIEQHQAIRT